MTEQATRYEISQPECRRIARQGPIYNPYKQVDPLSPRSPPSTRLGRCRPPDPTAVAIDGPQIASYGDLRQAHHYQGQPVNTLLALWMLFKFHLYTTHPLAVFFGCLAIGFALGWFGRARSRAVPVSFGDATGVNAR